MFIHLQKLALLAALTLSLSSCKKKQKIPDDTLVIGIAAAPQTLDPRFASDAPGMKITKLIFSSLVRMDADLQIVGDLATHWTYKDKIYSFQLPPGLKFSDSSPVTDNDFLFSFAEYQKASSPFAQAFSSIQKIESRYSFARGGELKLYLNNYSAALLTDLTTLKILPQKIVSQYGQDFYEHLIGSGPYLLENISDNEIRLQLRSDLSSQIKKVIFKIIRDDNSRFLKMYKGDLDIVQSDMPLAKVKIFKNSPRFTVYENAGLSMTYLLLNMRDPLLQQHDVRKAIHLAIHRDEIIQHKLEGFGVPATSLLTPGNPYFNSDLVIPLFDLSTAQSLLKNIKNTSHPLTLKTSNEQSAVENGKVIAFQLRRLGLDIKLKSFEWGTYYDDIKKGQFEIATMRWVGVTDPDIYRLGFHSEQHAPQGRNRGYYSNKKIDPWLESGVEIQNEILRKEHYKKIQALIYDDLPIIPLWYNKQISIVHNRVQNYKLPLNGDFSYITDLSKNPETQK